MGNRTTRTVTTVERTFYRCSDFLVKNSVGAAKFSLDILLRYSALPDVGLRISNQVWKIGDLKWATVKASDGIKRGGWLWIHFPMPQSGLLAGTDKQVGSVNRENRTGLSSLCD